MHADADAKYYTASANKEREQTFSERLSTDLADLFNTLSESESQLQAVKSRYWPQVMQMMQAGALGAPGPLMAQPNGVAEETADRMRNIQDTASRLLSLCSELQGRL